MYKHFIYPAQEVRFARNGLTMQSPVRMRNEERSGGSFGGGVCVKEPEGQRHAACNRAPRTENTLLITGRILVHEEDKLHSTG